MDEHLIARKQRFDRRELGFLAAGIILFGFRPRAQTWFGGCSLLFGEPRARLLLRKDDDAEAFRLVEL